MRHDSVVSQLEIDTPTAEQYLLDAVSGQAFQFLREIVLRIRWEQGLENRDEIRKTPEDVLVKLATRSDPANDDFILVQLADIIELIATKKYFLRNLRNREEDVAIRRVQPGPPIANFQAFLSFSALVYGSLPPDSAQHLWDSTSFTGAILDNRGGWPGLAFWDMLAAISSGPISASKAYEKLKDTRFQWNSLFKFYQHYYDIMPHLFEPIKSSRTASLDPVSTEDVEICRGWTSVLAVVVRYSSLARSALLQAKPHPLRMLFDFINCDIPLDLKATVMEAVTAFCTRTGDSADDDVLSKAVDFYERISFSDADLDTGQLDAFRVPPSIGWIAKMEYSEQDISSYPLTRAYIRFLTVLLPVQSLASGMSLLPRPRLTNALRRGTSYILDKVLLEPNARRYARDRERSDMLADIAAFLERALLGFDMSELLTQANSRAIGQIANSLSEEAGFAVLLRLLSEPGIFNILASVIDQAAAEPIPRPPRNNDVLLFVLRIYYHVLSIQLVFSDVLLLTLSDPIRSSSTTFRRPFGLQSLDQYLLAHLPNITAIALLIGDENLAISLTSIKIMTALAASPIFSRSDVFRGEYTTSINRLAGIIDASDDSIRIAQGVCSRLAGNSEDLAPEDVASFEFAVLRGDIDRRAMEALPLVVRSAILDLLIDGTLQDASGPNLAHFLLGLELKDSDFRRQDPDKPDSRLSCLRVILDQLSEGANPGSSASINIVSVHPVIAAKSMRVIHQLLSHPSTGRMVMHDAMSISGFSARQLASLPRVCPSSPNDAYIGLGTASVHEAEIATSADTLVAFLDFQRWTLSAVALETFAIDGHGASSLRVAELLFTESGGDEQTEADEPHGQQPPLIIDLLSSVNIQWREKVPDDVAPQRPLEFYGSFDFDLYKRPDVDCWDLEELGRSLQAFRKQLERQGAIIAGTSAKTMEGEAEYILRQLGIRHRETTISLAKGSFLTAWNEALKVSLAMLLQHISDEQQEVILFELLDALLDCFDGDQCPGVVEILCESVLVVMTSLINILADFDRVNLPVERLSLNLRRIIEAIVRPGTTENARGNLYAAITQYIQLLGIGTSIPDDASVAAPTIRHHTVKQSGSSQLLRATLKVIGSKKDRFIPALCRDAIDHRDVWKTECFTLLGGVVTACHSERERQILNPLSKDGYLPLFVRSIKEREIALQECLSPEPGDLVLLTSLAFNLTRCSQPPCLLGIRS